VSGKKREKKRTKSENKINLVGEQEFFSNEDIRPFGEKGKRADTPQRGPGGVSERGRVSGKSPIYLKGGARLSRGKEKQAKEGTKKAQRGGWDLHN